MTDDVPLRNDHLEVPHPSRLSLHHPFREIILARHRAAVQASHSSYRDPVSGLSVLTAAFLAERGWCCESGCRHCPFVGGDT